MFVDEWTVIHFSIFCACAGYLTMTKLPVWGIMLIATVAGFGWEFIELHFESQQDTYHGEPWHNRWISDPIFDLAGAGLGIWLVTRWKERNKKESGDG
jgi:hypothetical protein